ncbi:MAG: glycosyltransferase family 39 protein [Actinobacteria bacterium]|nr:glycosyltransferase family 39 protein [Actinomycetota bacterium]
MAVDGASSMPNSKRPTDTDPPAVPRWDRRDALALAVIAVVIAIPMRGLLRDHGAAMEEGFMLVFPEQVMSGRIPNKDFLHLYGPGSLWVLAGVYKVFGVSLATERWFGLVQHVGIITGLYWVIRRWGRSIAMIAALTAIFINLNSTGLSALAWNGAIAFGIWAVWALLRARESGDRRWLLVGSGVLVSLALLYRPDVILAVSLASLVALWPMRWRRLAPFLAGLGLAAVGYIVQVIMAGPGNAFRGMFTDPVFTLRMGRTLPMPPVWDHLVGYFQKAAVLRTVGWPFPHIGMSQQLYFWFFITILAPFVVIAVALRTRTRDDDPRRPAALLVLGVFGAGLLTQALQRADQTHLAWVGVITISSLPAAVAQFFTVRPIRRPAWEPWRAPVAASLGAVAFFAAVTPQFTIRAYNDAVLQSINRDVIGFPIQRNGRNFYVPSPSIATAAQELTDKLDGLGPRPGERLFVGPADLRYTPYTDAFFYYLFPELPPATYYIEMDPFDSGPETRLASDVNSADWVILTNVWNAWIEPNNSMKAGSNVPNEIIRRDFCKVGAWGLIPDYSGRSLPMYQLYRRCKPRRAL